MNLTAFQELFTSWLAVFAADPVVQLLQIGMVALALLMVCIVFFTTRDVLLRSNSFVFMLFSIVLVTLLPLVGFILYLLIRPARTVAQRRLEQTLATTLEHVQKIEKKLEKKPKPKHVAASTRKKHTRSKK